MGYWKWWYNRHKEFLIPTLGYLALPFILFIFAYLFIMLAVLFLFFCLIIVIVLLCLISYKKYKKEQKPLQKE